MTDTEPDRKKRADERRNRMKVRFTTLDDQTDPWPVFGAEAIDLACQITTQIWELSGKTFPKYRRSEMPIRFANFDSE